MFHLAQTVGALYRQLHALGYGPYQLRAVQRVHGFSSRVFSGLHHGSGKPFICHLVGTASAVAAMDARVEMVCAGLAHDMLEHGPFPDGQGATASRARLQAELGPFVYELISQFRRFRWDDESIAGFAARPPGDDATRNMLILRLASEMDDLANMGMALGPKQGPARSRLQDCIKIASGLGQQEAARTLEILIDEHERVCAWAGELNPGATAPFRILPNLLTYLRLRLRGDPDVY